MSTLMLTVPTGADDRYTDLTTLQSDTTFISAGKSTNVRSAGLRFTNVTIPPGSTINSAVLSLTAQSSLSTTTCALNVSCEDADNPGQWTNYTDFSGRSRTASPITWTEGSETANSTYSPPDIKAAVQAVINRSGWASGNALIVYIDNNGSSTNARRAWFDRSNGSSTAATLAIDYTPPASSTPPPLLFSGKAVL